MVTINNSINNTVGASNSGVTNTFTITNPSNTASSAAQLLTTVGGTTAGNAWHQYTVGTAASFAMGVLNGATPVFNMTYAASGTANPSTATPAWTFTGGTGFNYDVSGTTSLGIGLGVAPTTNYPINITKSANAAQGIQISNTTDGAASEATVNFNGPASNTGSITLFAPSSSVVALQNTFGIDSGQGAVCIFNSLDAYNIYSNNGSALTSQMNAASNGCQIKGKQTNTPAPTGYMGEVIITTIANFTVNMATSTPTQVGSISLTAGNWLVYGTIAYNPTVSMTEMQAGINIASAAFTTPGVDWSAVNGFTSLTGNAITITSPPITLSLAATTTYFLNGFGVCASGSINAGGKIVAIRIG